MIPLSHNYPRALITLSTGILPDPGGLDDQDADFVDTLRQVHRESQKVAAERMKRIRDG